MAIGSVATSVASATVKAGDEVAEAVARGIDPPATLPLKLTDDVANAGDNFVPKKTVRFSDDLEQVKFYKQSLPPSSLNAIDGVPNSILKPSSISPVLKADDFVPTLNTGILNTGTLNTGKIVNQLEDFVPASNIASTAVSTQKSFFNSAQDFSTAYQRGLLLAGGGTVLAGGGFVAYRLFNEDS